MRLVILTIAACLLAWLSPLPAQAPQEEPEEIGKSEEVEVRLILVETLVLDKDGRTVPDLSEDDVRLAVGRDISKIATLDVDCPAGATDDPVAVDRGEAHPMAPDTDRRIVFLFDYYNLSAKDRSWVLNQAALMIRQNKTPREEIMIAALADGLRVEQRFTADADELLDTLDRMEHDVSLWGRDLSGTTGREYFDGLATLMDVLAAYDDSKAVVMFSALLSRGDVYESWFEDVAERAAAGRTVIYPAVANWYEAPAPKTGGYRLKGSAGGKRALPAFAVETGGRMPPDSQDPTLAYAWAQRDLSCRYAVGFEIGSDEALQPHAVRVGTSNTDLEVFYPRKIRLWTEEQQLASRLRAAFADPERFEDALVRAHVFPLRPTSTRTWDSAVVVHLTMPVGPDGADLDLRATLTRDGSTKADEFHRPFRIPPSKDGQPSLRAVTLFGDSTLRAGKYEFTVAISVPGKTDVAASRVVFEVPEVPRTGTFLRGPILARVVRDGVLIRADQDETTEETELDRLLGDDESFEPLLVADVSASDTMFTAWQACAAGKSRSAPGSVVERRIVDESGNVVHTLDSVTLTLEGKSKVLCHGALDKLPANTFKPGEYTLEISIEDGNGESLANRSAPFRVR